jgi:hypothetical protein
MNPETKNLLELPRLPARLTLDQTAILLGFNAGDITILMAAKLIKPLGHPPQNGPKYFALCEIDLLRADAGFLAKASDALVRHWRRRNAPPLAAVPHLNVACG